MKYTCKKWVLSQCYKIRTYVVNSILINISCIEMYKDNHFSVIEKKINSILTYSFSQYHFNFTL